ncbi:MAG: YbhB/YbcL family Raf kinase inhibitor-like protein [Pseudomonadota bacterium]
MLCDAAKETVALTLTSTAFDQDGDIPSRYTCEGEDIAPPLTWADIPAAAQSLILIVDDPDAPDPRAPQMTWVHWVLCNLPPDTPGLPEGATSNELPPGTAEGINDWNRPGYGGPCPPVGRHRYVHKLYALDIVLTGIDRPTKADVEAAMAGHVIEQAELVGTYEKTR